MRFKDFKQGGYYIADFKDGTYMTGVCKTVYGSRATFLNTPAMHEDWWVQTDGRNIRPATESEVAEWKAKLIAEYTEKINQL